MSFDLFQLVPAVYRLRDSELAATMVLLTPAEQIQRNALETKVTPLTKNEEQELAGLQAKAARGPLESLLMVIDEQLAVMAEDLDQLYDDQFIETCAPWVIPYLGDLIGYQSIHGIPPAVDNPRSEVASTISLRRRKGTVLVLEQLARDVTGYGAHAVEYFKLLGTTQYMKHVRPQNVYAPDVRNWKTRRYEDTGFSLLTRKVDVHNLTSPGVPRPNLRNIGIYLWSLGAYSVTLGPPSSVASTNGAACFRVSSEGVDLQLFHRAMTQGEKIEEAATTVNVAGPLAREMLCDDLQLGVGSAFYGEGSSLALYLSVGGKLQMLNPYQLKVANLSGPDGTWLNVPPAAGDSIALIDPELGRIALPAGAGATPPLTVSFHYGFNAAMAGGEYERRQSFLVTDPAAIFPFPDTDPGGPRYLDIPSALTFVAATLGAQGAAALELSGSETIALATAFSVDIASGCTLELRARDGARPTLLLNGEFSILGDADSTCRINGIIFAAASTMIPAALAPRSLLRVPKLRGAAPNLLGTLSLTHCTLTPGWTLKPAGPGDESIFPVQADQATLLVEAPGAHLTATLSILGPIAANQRASVSLSDCILDATATTLTAYASAGDPAGGAPLALIGCTAVGKIHAAELTLVSNSIVWAESDSISPGLVADRLQVGCVRFSFLPYKAITPRRFQCVERALASSHPVFSCTRYGLPAYLKLWAGTPQSIRRGADDGGEMGAFHFLLAPLRETDLIVRLREYTPVGLDTGLIYNS